MTGDTIRIVDNKKDKSFVLKIETADKKDNCYKIQYRDLYLENGFEVYKIADGKTAEEWKIGRMEDWTNKEDKIIKSNKPLTLSTAGFFSKIALQNLFIRINNIKWMPLLKNVKAATAIKLSKENILSVKNFLSQKNINDLYFELPPYIEEKDIKVYENFINFVTDKKYNKFFINNISQIYMFEGKKSLLYAGQYLYTLNNYAAEFLSEYKINGFCSSWEDDLQNIKDLSKVLKNNLIVYLSGFPEIVTSKMEFVSEIRNKNIKSDKDEFKVFSNNNENIIIPKYPINLLSFKNSLLNAGIKSFGIDLSYIEPNTNYLTQIVKAFNNNAYISSQNKFNFERKLR